MFKMTFKKARQKLKKLAKGKYFTVNFEVTEHADGELNQDCTLYIDGLGHNRGKTWKEAFALLDQKLNPSPVELEDENIDEIDVDNQPAL